jgi:hypothetical protein
LDGPVKEQEFREILDVTGLSDRPLWSEGCPRMKTRRDTLLGAAILAFRPTGAKLSVFADPIVPAIARHRAAAAAYAAAPSDETHADAADAFDALCATEPTTLPGLKMLADQLVEEFDGEWAGDIDAFEIALTTLRNALTKITADHA